MAGLGGDPIQRATPATSAEVAHYADRRLRRFGLHCSAHRAIKATEVAVLSDSLIDIGEGWEI